jgi:hypothetical protein
MFAEYYYECKIVDGMMRFSGACKRGENAM